MKSICCAPVEIVVWGQRTPVRLACACAHTANPECPCVTPPPPEPPSFFEQIVGIPVDDWVAADTAEKFADLLRRRDGAA